MDDSQRARFLSISAMMTDIATGIGAGQRRLVTEAETRHGTLSVKTAEVAVEFLLSSTTTVGGLAVPGVGANTLFGVGVTQDQQSSKAKISLQIVPIVPQNPEAPPTAAGASRPGGNITGGMIGPFVAVLRGLIEKARDDKSISAGRRASLVSELEAISDLAERGSLSEASSRLDSFTKTHAEWVARHQGA